MNAQLFKLGWQDLIKGLIIAVLSAVLTMLINQLQNGSIDWNNVLNVVAIATMSYLLKQLGTDTSGNTLGIKMK